MGQKINSICVDAVSGVVVMMNMLLPKARNEVFTFSIFKEKNLVVRTNNDFLPLNLL